MYRYTITNCEKWHKDLVRILKNMPLTEAGKNNWKAIVQEMEMIHPEIFSCCTNKERKLMDFVKRNKTLIAELMRELEEQEKSPKSKKTAKKTTTKKTSKVAATSAHVNDDDKDYESEDEVVPADKLIQQKKNPDGSTSIEKEVYLEKEDESMSEEEVAKHLNIDLSEYEITSYSVRKGTWDAQIKGGSIKQLHSFRISANAKKRTDSLYWKDLADQFLREAAKANRPVHKIQHVKGKNIAIICIADLHLGKLSWSPETGENYDYKIAKDNFNYIINRAITSIKSVDNVDRIIFFWSQDFFHYDTTEITTTAGTRQDSDVRWPKLFMEGVDLLVKGIQMIADAFENIPIQTFYTRSNHDTQTSFYALQYVSAWFRNDEQVEVDTEPSGRKYVEYGCNLLGFGHGDKEGKRMPSIMPNEAPEAWGRTWNHEYFLGHFHSQRIVDDHGVTCRYLASPTSTDAWHYDSGYIGALKQAQVFIRNKNEGPIAEFTINIRN